MRACRLLVTAVLLASRPALAEDSAGWKTRPAAYFFGTWEEGRGEWPDLAALPRPGTAAGAALSFEAERRAERTEWRFSGLGSLRRHWLSEDGVDADRWGYSVRAAGRGAWSLSSRLRLSLDDDARAERLPGFGSLVRNQVSASLEAKLGGRGSLTLTLADRRRSVDNASDLGFARQTATLGAALTLSGRQALGFEAGVQPYQTDTARGERLIVSAEHSTVTRRGVTALRAAWWRPLGDRRASALGAPPELPGQIDRANRSVLLESHGRPTTEAPASEGVSPPDTSPDFVADSLFLHSYLDNDADEWDFGRRKWLLVAFHSHRLGDRVYLSGLVRAQFRRGPDLLDPGAGNGPFDDTRLFFRLLVRHRLTQGATLIAEAAYLDSRSDRPDFDFSRGLVGLGLHWRF